VEWSIASTIYEAWQCWRALLYTWEFTWMLGVLLLAMVGLVMCFHSFSLLLSFEVLK